MTHYIPPEHDAVRVHIDLFRVIFASKDLRRQPTRGTADCLRIRMALEASGQTEVAQLAAKLVRNQQVLSLETEAISFSYPMGS